MKIWRMIKNKILYNFFKNIFRNIENRLKTFHIPKQTFILQNIIYLFSKTGLKNCFPKLF